MNTNIERNRQLVRSLCGAGRIVGWVFIALAVFAVAQGILEWKNSPETGFSILYLSFFDAVSTYFFPGLVVLGAMQFVRYLLEENYQPGWILSKGHLILYFFAVSLLFRSILYLGWGRALPKIHDINYVMVLLSSIIPCLIQSLTLIVMGLILRMTLPIIAESKTLA